MIFITTVKQWLVGVNSRDANSNIRRWIALMILNRW
jgi:hypothetical protein